MKEKKFSKKDNVHYFKILGIVLIGILFYAACSNLGTVTSFLGKILGVLSPLIGGLCIAFVLNLPMRFFEEKVFKKLSRKDGKVWKKIKRPICLTLSLLLVLSVVVILLSFVIPEFIRTCDRFFTILPDAMKNLNVWITDVAEKLHVPLDPSSININWNQISAWALDIIEKNQSQIAQGAVGIVSGIFSTVVNTLIAIVFSIYVLASKESLGRLAKSFIYSIMKREHARKFISVVVLSNKAFSGFVAGQCTEVALIGCLCYFGMLIFRMPFPIMVSCVIAVTAFIPVFGPFIGTAIGAFLILVQSPIKALWFVIFIIVLQQLESNIIYPRIMGKHVGLPGIWVLAAVTVGGGLFGVVGIITSVPIFSVIYTLFDRWMKKRLREKNICHSSMSHDSTEPKTLIDEYVSFDIEENDYAESKDDAKEAVETSAEVENGKENSEFSDTSDSDETKSE